MFVTTNYQLGFIHIPKCGGTSVYRSFTGELYEYKQRLDMPWSPWPIHEAHTKFRTVYQHKSFGKLGDVHPPPAQWFTVVRNPYARFHTWYYYQQEWDRKRYSGELERKGLTDNQLEERLRYWDKSTPLSVLLDLDNLKQKGGHWKGITRNISECQWAWIVGSNAKAFRLEKIKKMWNWLEELGTHAVPVHVKQNKAKTGSWKDFDEETLVNIQKRYETDFRKLKYDLVIT